jgi:signal transduction histidine kinase
MDGKRIGWVVNQLLDNAIKFTPRGGIVGLSAAREQDFVKILVQDTGIGIPAERISEIFEPFHQLDSTISRRYPGTGLGLAMVQRILDVHGSLIKCKSNEGQGSLFEFSLPLAIEDNERADC